MSEVSKRMPEGPPYWPELWPGEHYKLLAALVSVTGARRIVGIGTHTGLSALAMLQELPEHGKLTTFDIVPWAEISTTALVGEDFADRRASKSSRTSPMTPPFRTTCRFCGSPVV